MKNLLPVLLMIVTACSLYAQVLIGMTDDDIIEYIEKNYPNYTLNTGFGATSNTVKFVDDKNDRTMIFFLDEKNRCKYSKLMLDIGEYDKTVEVLNKTYKKIGDMKWVQRKEGVDYLLIIEKTDWMFSILTQKKE
ncbi:MAG: hypothetical protein ABIJ16_01855 [Bacteroidota bacterium]